MTVKTFSIVFCKLVYYSLNSKDGTIHVERICKLI